MSKLLCLCGYTINLTRVPCEHEYLLLPDADSVDIWDMPSKEDALTEMHRRAKQVIKCPNCGRLAVLWGDSNDTSFYLPERTVIDDPSG